jgi:hypothetical protein
MIVVDSGDQIQVYQAQVTPLEAVGYLQFGSKVIMEQQLGLDLD